MTWVIKAAEGIQWGWVIDKSWIDVEDQYHEGGEPTFPPKEINIVGPRGTPFSREEILSKGKRFRLYDDDGILYYEGSMYDAGNTGEEADFSPLNDWGTPGAGCTEIRYQEEGGWVTI